jgi:zinc protease
VSTGVAPQKVDQAIASIIAEIDRLLNEPINWDELADSQAFRIGSLPVSLETNDGLASIFTDMELFSLGMDYLQRLPDKIGAMTPDSVQAAARRYLSSGQIAIAVAGPDGSQARRP